MKRVEKEIKEQEHKKKAKIDVFAEIPDDANKQITQAVQSALKPQSKQPIILQVMRSDDPGQNDYELAYWPSSQDIGERFMKTLILLRDDDMDRHCELVSILTYDDDEYDIAELDDYLGDTLKKVSQLGKFKYLAHWFMEKDREIDYCDRTSLDTFLYHEQCYDY